MAICSLVLILGTAGPTAAERLKTTHASPVPAGPILTLDFDGNHARGRRDSGVLERSGTPVGQPDVLIAAQPRRRSPARDGE